MDETVFCAETGRQISSDPGSNVIYLASYFTQPVLAIDNDEDAARYAQAMTMRTNVTFATIDEAAKQEISETAGRLAEEEDWI
ncbi:hypothetical protein GOL22_14060 [Sinorhizobium medicae]|nr:hypothetical protein [Sinorhizobium medicae]